jgi:alanine dehydrogenase
MKTGAVLVDVAVDQGGCIESTHATTHKEPVFIEEGIVHYGVANMPSAVALSSTIALTSVTFPYALMIAQLGLTDAIDQSESLRKGVNLYKGACTYKAVAESLELPYTPVDEVL